MALRLTLWHATIFSTASFLVFLILYLLLVSGTLKRTDIALVDQVEEFASLLKSQGLDSVTTEIAQEAAAAGTGMVFFRVLSATSEEISASDTSKWLVIEPDDEACAQAASGRPVFQTIEPDNNVAGVRVLYYRLGSGAIIQIGRSLEADEQLFGDYRSIFAAVMLAVMALAAIVGWLMARRAMAGVEEVTRTAGAISAGLLDTRVPLSGRGDEIDRLGSTFNTMLDISETEAGVEELRLTEVDMSGMVHETIDFVRLAAEDKGLELRFEACTNTSIPADTEKLKRAVFNALGNAVKYAPADGRVALSIERTDDPVGLFKTDSYNREAADCLHARTHSVTPPATTRRSTRSPHASATAPPSPSPAPSNATPACLRRRSGTGGEHRQCRRSRGQRC